MWRVSRFDARHNLNYIETTTNKESENTMSRVRLSNPKRPLRKVRGDWEVRFYQTRPCDCGYQLSATWSYHDRDYSLEDEGCEVHEQHDTLTEAQEAACQILAEHECPDTTDEQCQPIAVEYRSGWEPQIVIKSNHQIRFSFKGDHKSYETEVEALAAATAAFADPEVRKGLRSMLRTHDRWAGFCSDLETVLNHHAA